MVLSDEEKLNLLQRFDRFRMCGEIVTGREIQVVRDTRRNALLRLVCPTAHCDARPVEWVLPTEEVLIAMAEGWRRRNL
jgi:hypothetical protein